MDTVSKNINVVYDQISESISDKKINAASVFIITVNAMEAVEKIIGLSGEDKKRVVIGVVKKIIIEANIDKDVKDSLITVTDTVLPFAIDIIVSATKGQLKINIQGWCGSCCGGCQKCKCNIM